MNNFQGSPGNAGQILYTTEIHKLIKPNNYVAKVDLKSAYRYVYCHNSDHDSTGLKWTFSGDDNPTYIARKVLMNKRNPLLQSHIASAIIKKSSKYAIHITLYTLFMILHTDSLNYWNILGEARSKTNQT
jgi:hypothetical protein